MIQDYSSQFTDKMSGPQMTHADEVNVLLISTAGWYQS